MNEFILLFRSSYPTTQVPPQPPLQPWRAWVSQLQAAGSLVALPYYFNETGRVLTKGQPVANGPYVEGSDFIVRLLLIKVADYEAAIQIAQNCPVLALGDTIEVRRAL